MTRKERYAVIESRLHKAHPDFAGIVRLLVLDLEDYGYQPIVDGGIFRTPAEQAEKVRLGFSTVYFSFHNAVRFLLGRLEPCALAADVVDVRYQWNISQDHPYWKKQGALAKKRGLRWGGDWRTHDVAHVQYLKDSLLSKVKQFYQTGGAKGYFPPISGKDGGRLVVVQIEGQAEFGGLLKAGTTYVQGKSVRDRWKGASFSWDAKMEVLTVSPKI